MTYIVAIHDISDPDRFWAWTSAEPPGELPPGVTLHSVYPRDDGLRAVCLWEAPSVDAVREILDAGSGDAARNEYFEVAPQHPGTIGLPTQSQAQS
jgi:hypothetical protein